MTAPRALQGFVAYHLAVHRYYGLHRLYVACEVDKAIATCMYAHALLVHMSNVAQSAWVCKHCLEVSWAEVATCNNAQLASCTMLHVLTQATFVREWSKAAECSSAVMVTTLLQNNAECTHALSCIETITHRMRLQFSNALTHIQTS